MPLDTRLQDVNRILDPGIKTFAPDSSAFLPAYQHAQNRADRLEQQKYERGIVSQATGQSPNEMFSQFTQLPTEKMYEKIGEMAPMAATPAGGRIIGVLSGIADRKAHVEQQSLSKQTALAIMKKQAEFNAEAINAGVDIANPEELSAFKLRRSTAETMKAFTDLGIKLGKDVSKVEIPPDQIDQFGNWKDPATPLNLLRNAPRSQVLQSLEDRAGDTADVQRQRIESLDQYRQEANELKRENMDMRWEMHSASEEGRNLRQQALLEARRDIEAGQVSREQFINRQVGRIMEELSNSSATRRMSAEEKQRRAMEIAGSSWDKHIGSSRSAPAQPITVAPNTTFTKGQRAKQNGVVFEFDGTKWNEVK